MAALFLHIIRSYYPGIIFGLIILAISVAPVSGEGRPLIFSFPGSDKVVHSIIYCVFTILLTRDYLRYNPLKWIRLLFFLLAILGYSIIIEVIQLSLTSYRSGELLDVVANLAGISIGAGAVLLYRKIKS
ncbi:VanZ family protein [Bacteroidota bacterium]